MQWNRCITMTQNNEKFLDFYLITCFYLLSFSKKFLFFDKHLSHNIGLLNYFLHEFFSYGLVFGSVWALDKSGLRISLAFGSVLLCFIWVWAFDQKFVRRCQLNTWREKSNHYLFWINLGIREVWGLNQFGASDQPGLWVSLGFGSALVSDQSGLQISLSFG